MTWLTIVFAVTFIATFPIGITVIVRAFKRPETSAIRMIALSFLVSCWFLALGIGWLASLPVEPF